jgi:hypothetical protein
MATLAAMTARTGLLVLGQAGLARNIVAGAGDQQTQQAAA